MTNSRPDRTSDGVKEVMIAISEAFRSNTSGHVTMHGILPKTKMHRLTLDKYISLAKKEGLIKDELSGWYTVTEKGYEYLVLHNIVEG